MTDTAEAGSVVETPAGNPAQPTAPADNGSAADAGKSWFEGLPLTEGNRRLAETKGWTSPESLEKAFTSYAELERKQGDSLRVPEADAPKEDWDKFYARLPEDMRPIESPDKLEFRRPEGLPEDVPYTADLADASKSWMHEAGLNGKQAQVVHDKFVGYMAEQAKAQQVAMAKSVEDTSDALVKDWGPQDSEGFKTNLQLADRAMKNLGLVDAMKAKGVLLPDGALTEPQIAKAFAAIGEAMFKEDTVGGGAPVSGENPFKKDASGNRSMTAISALVKNDPQRARQLAKEAGENPDVWVSSHPL